MLIVNGRNVCQNLDTAVRVIRQDGERQSSRAGDVLVAPCPVMTVTYVPTERVLFDPVRDANPFFHLFESLWMLSGSDDATWLDQFVGDFSARFAEEGGRQWGAYGHRWRNRFGEDQLNTIVGRLLENPLDRRVVLSMWDPVNDPAAADRVRDVPCNTQIYPRMRQVRKGEWVLDLTVTCRSNDIIWGAYGANAVHFSVLQEYLAGRIGCDVGVLYQLSNNWHAYESTIARADRKPHDPYEDGLVSPFPIMQDAGSWDSDLSIFMHFSIGQEETREEAGITYRGNQDFFEGVAEPLLWAHQCWRKGDNKSALRLVSTVQASDWQRAAMEWIGRRIR